MFHGDIFQFFILTFVLLLAAMEVEGIGVIWGTEATHPLPPEKVVQLLKSNRIAKVRLLDTDPQILLSLAGSGITVTLGIPNSLLPSLNSSAKVAVDWVHDNLTQFISGGGSSKLLVDYVAVGDDLFLAENHPFAVGAAVNLQRAIMKANLADKVRLVFPCSFNAFIPESGLPSKTRFRRDINATMIHLLKFLNLRRSPFFVTISPFRSYTNFSLDFALFRETSHPVNDTHKNYTNLFDLKFDAVVSALSSAGFPKMEIIISKTGWPTDGAPDATSDLKSRWCVVNENLDISNASLLAMEACSGGDCSALAPGSSCFNLSWPGNISYAFNRTVDPSVESCRFVVGIKTSDSPAFTVSFTLIFTILFFFW